MSDNPIADMHADYALQHSTNPLILLQSAIDRGMDPEKLGRLMDLADRWREQQAAEAFALAMAACQSELPAVVRDAVNSHTKSRYARFETLNAQIKPIYTRHGFSLSFTEEDSPLPNHVRVFVDVEHTGGKLKRHRVDFPMDGTGIKGNAMMTPIQAKVSTISYARRALVKLAFNMAEADEDKDGAGLHDVIGPVQIEQLNELIVGKGVDLGRFLAWAQIENLEQMSVAFFPKALDMLQRKAKGGQ